MRKSITVIVPYYNESDRLGDVLKVLVRVRGAEQVIAVDDGSDDGGFGEKIRAVKHIRLQKKRIIQLFLR